MNSLILFFLPNQGIADSTIVYTFFRLITELGSELFFIIVIPPIYWCINKKFGFRLFVIATLAAYITTTVKNIIRIPRPSYPGDMNIHQTYAFPSGHSHGVTAFWLYLYVNYKKIIFAIIGISIITLVAISRVYLHVHYPGDVFAGIAFGIGMVAIFIVFEPKVTSIIRSSRFEHKLLLGIIVPLLLLFHASLYFNTDPQGVKLAAALLGIFIGSVLETEYLGFIVISSFLIKCYRTILGLSLAYLAYFGLGMVIPFNLATCIFTAFLGGFTVTLIAPWVFSKVEKNISSDD